MTEEERHQIKSKIESELKDLGSKINNLKEVTQPVKPDNAIGRISRMDAINNKAVNDAALVKANERKSKLENVLRNMDQPEFGICMKCKSPIPQLRLIHLPESKLCVKCASR